MAQKITADPAVFTLSKIGPVTLWTESGSAAATVELGVNTSPAAPDLTNAAMGRPDYERLPSTPATTNVEWVVAQTGVAAGDLVVVGDDVRFHQVRISGHGGGKFVVLQESV